jgi:heptosyltransferase-3
LMNRLSSEGDEVAVIGAPEDKERVGVGLRELGRKVHDLSGKTNLNELAALLKRAAVFVGPDSGPAHLAVALRTPSVLIYSGVNDLRRWGPWTLGREDRVRLFHYGVSCSPCGLPVCPTQKECLAPIGVREVFEAVQSFKDNPKGA